MVNTERKAARSFVVNYGRYAANIYYVLLLVGLFHLQSFIPGLKPTFSANPSRRSLPFLLPD